ncbi:MAG TPA: hypothetical protein VGG64_08060 [Pirellulales bacterium]|jgi:hypothetical protein
MIARRTLRLSLASYLATAALALGIGTSLRAQEKADDPLPLKKVVLYNAGVGYYERRAEIDGNAKVDLKFNVSDINDLLKSMVLQDLAGGKISNVTYSSMDPITKTLKTFAIDLTDNPTMADLLDQVRGEKVEIEAPNRITGTILGVETRQQQVGDKDRVNETEFLNLLTDTGLRSFAMPTITRVKLVEPKLDAELRQALSVLALGHATDKKTVTLAFEGTGKRPVSVGYIQQSPIWRTTYRLVLSDKNPPFLQGWALVENPTEGDWQDVSLTLVSGRPISFIMNLYQPLYVPRPLVEPEQFASLRPQVYGQDLARRDLNFSGKQLPGQGYQRRMLGGMGGGMGGGMMGGAPSAEYFALNGQQQQAAGEAVQVQDPQQGPVSYNEVINLSRGVNAAAQAGDVGELFQYVIESPVTLPRQQSAMLPIINSAVQGEKLSIYNPAVQPKHPLNGVRLKNTTDLHLLQGPITVFDDNAFAGDARIEDLPPGSERLISYALDLDVEVSPESKSAPEQLTSVKIAKGTVISTRKHQRTQSYTVKNSAKHERKVLIEYPYDANWKLIEPQKAEEKTRDLYRFVVMAEPGKPATLKLVEEQTVSQQVVITNLTDDVISFYERSSAVSDAVKKALSEVVKRKQQIQSLTTKRQGEEQTINAITQEQTRIRENMSRLDRNNELYNRYVKKFSEQEDQIENSRASIKDLDGQVNEQQKQLDEYMLSLDLS